MVKPKLNKGYGFLRRKQCFGNMDAYMVTDCSGCSEKERDDCFKETFKEELKKLE